MRGEDQPTYAKSVVNASYVQRRRSLVSHVKPIEPTVPSEPSTLKVKQYLNQLAKQERQDLRRQPCAAEGEPASRTRSCSLDFNNSGPSHPRIFEYKVDSNKLADNKSEKDSCRTYSVDPNLIKPVALKPLVFSNPDVSISEALGSGLFGSGSIPTNKEIDHILEVIKSVRKRTVSEELPDHNHSMRQRRHSDISDLKRSSKRSIKDPPVRKSLRNSPESKKSLGEKRFGSSCSAFTSIRRSQTIIEEPSTKPKHPQNCSEVTVVDDDTSNHYPVLSTLKENISDFKPNIPQKCHINRESPPFKYTTHEIVIKNPVLPPINKMSPSRSPDNDRKTLPQPESSINGHKLLIRSLSGDNHNTPSNDRRSSSTSSSTSVRDHMVHRNQGRRSHSSSSGHCPSSPGDIVFQNNLLRRARQRHNKCSHPCMANTSEQEGIDNSPSPRFSPNTHPRAQLPSYLATCSGNHPPVSYLNSIKRSKSMQVNHIEICDDRTFHRLRSKQFNKKIELSPSQIINVPNEETKNTISCPQDPDPRPTHTCHPDCDPRPHASHQEEPCCSRAGVSQANSSERLSPYDVDQVKELLKKVGRKYLSDRCTLHQTNNPEIDKKHSLSFVFSGNKDLQEKVRHFFQETNKNYCKRLIKQRFESNLSDLTPESSIVDAEDLVAAGASDAVVYFATPHEAEYKPQSLFVGQLPNSNNNVNKINIETKRRNSTNVEESIHSFLVKSDNLVTNKSNNYNDHDKLKKSNLKDILDSFKSPVLPVCQFKSNNPLTRIPLKNPHTINEGFSDRPKFNSTNSSTSGSSDVDSVMNRNGSKASRDSGYGDSTSASNEGLNPPRQPRTRSASLTILSKLKPLFRFKTQREKETLVPDENNPFNSIFDDHPLSDLTRSLENLITRRASLQGPVTTATKSPESSSSQNDSVFDSPMVVSDTEISDVAPPQTPEELLKDFNALFSSGSMATSQVLTSQNSLFGSGSMATSQVLASQMTGDVVSEDEEFRVSPLPINGATDNQVVPDDDDDVFYIVRDRSFSEDFPGQNVPTYTPDKFSLQDIQEILDSYDVLQTRAQNNSLSGISSEKEYHKVHTMLQSKLTVALSSIYHTLTNTSIPSDDDTSMAVISLENTLNYLDDLLEVEEDNADVLELVGLLESFETLIQLHDEIISRTYYDNETLPEMPPGRSATVQQEGSEKNTAQSIYRMVGLHKNRGEPLGITLKKDGNKVVVHRILAGGMIDRQKLLHIGDEIISINGTKVEPRPDLIQNMLRDQEGDIQLKIIPSYKEQTPICQVYVKAHFNYDPKTDNLLPCKEAGLPFKKGDILQIVNQEDANWWQAKIEGGTSQAGLIPGQILQEQRMAAKGLKNEKSSSVGCGGATRKKKNKKMNYSANKNSEFDQHEINLYEEVAKMPPFNRKTLVLIGAQGVGRRSLISKLVLNEPDKFGNTMPHTSRPIRAGEKDGGGYWFTIREKMNEDIANHMYLEYGEYEGHLYGTKLDSIRQVMRSGKMCLLDVNPQSLKVLKTSEFVPFIVFIEAPSFEVLVRMHKESARDNPNKTFSESDLKKSIEESKRLKRQYSHYFDEVIQNNNMDDTYDKLYRCISKLSTCPQWVPVSWVY